MRNDQQDTNASDNSGWLAQWKTGVLPLVYLILGLLAVRWTLVEPYVVPTGSMEPTLKTGDRLYALKCAYDIRFPFTDWILFKTGSVERGDVILFRAPHEPEKTYVKRAVGLPGDRVEMRNGVLFINGMEVKKKLFPSREILDDIDNKDSKSLYVEKLGDVQHYVILDRSRPNYRNFPPVNLSGESLDFASVVPEGHYFAVGDNRDHSFDSRGWGFVPKENLKGQAVFIWFSSWYSNIRTQRVGTLIL